MSNDPNDRITMEAENAAHAYLELLASRGIEYFFANAGTDFGSIVDAFVARKAHGKDLPKPVTVPHEIPLVSMAHGYYLATGRPQAAMVHVGVGTANALGAIMTAARARVPILFTAGRTPIDEEGSRASRNAFIHWGQESFDQAGMLREFVKWDYELRNPRQLETVVDRALTIAMSDPKGPVYLTLPREILAEPIGEVTYRGSSRYDLPTFHPDPGKIEQAADILTRAEFPMIVTSGVGRSPDGANELASLAEQAGIGVISFNPEFMNLPLDHPCHQGFFWGDLIERCDAILVLDCDVPWYPGRAKPRESTTIIQAGIDPLYPRYPIRGFPSDLTVQGDPVLILKQLAKAMADHPDRDDEKIDTRREELGSRHDLMISGWEEEALRGSTAAPLDQKWVSHTLRKTLGDDIVVVNEYDNGMKENMSPRPGSYFGISHAGYLGWGMGAALGLKLALPDTPVIATVGDGSYMFAVPSACHFMSSSMNLPVLTIIYNNRSWRAVKQATLGMHPDGWAAGQNEFPLSVLEPSPDYEKICEAFGGYGEKVTSPDQVGPALERAMDAVTREKRHAVLNMVCSRA